MGLFGPLGKIISALDGLFEGVEEIKASRARVISPAALSDVEMDPAMLRKLKEPSGYRVKREFLEGIDSRVSRIIALVRKGKRHPLVQKKVAEILSRKCGGAWCVKEKDWSSEVKAIFAAVRGRVRYQMDPRGVDTYRHPARTWEWRAGDCFTMGTMLLRDDHELVPVEAVRTGDRIWGRDRWSTVTNTWKKGMLKTWLVQLNNGSSMRMSPEHKFWTADCKRHGVEQKCACPIAERDVHRVTMRELQPGQVLLQPERLPFGTGKMDPDKALVEGLYLSDGWSSHPGDFAIAGKDGFPKEAQKKLVQDICGRLGLRTRWHERYITVLDAEWTARLRTMGSHAPQKRALSINLEEGAALNLLRGIMADSGKNSGAGKIFGQTFTTTSRALWLQTRVLLKMAGITCSERYITEHGGLGTNPIWRLQTRVPKRTDNKPMKLLRVKSIVQDGQELPCFDIATDDHYVYLPEADCTVSNCDDYSSLLAALLEAAGYPTKLRVVAVKPNPPTQYSHILVLVGMQPRQPTKWVPLIIGYPKGDKFAPLDASVSMPPGWYPKHRISGFKDYDIPA